MLDLGAVLIDALYLVAPVIRLDLAHLVSEVRDLGLDRSPQGATYRAASYALSLSPIAQRALFAPGFWIPFAGEVAWEIDGRQEVYWQGRVETWETH